MLLLVHFSFYLFNNPQKDMSFIMIAWEKDRKLTEAKGLSKVTQLLKQKQQAGI